MTLQEEFSESKKFADLFFPSKAIVSIEEYSEEKFGNRLCSCITNGQTITFNKDWIETRRPDSDDIPFFLIHELRHIYQQDQVRKLKAGESIQEAPDIIKKWEFDWLHYIWNTGDRESREKNINQEVEMDANGYALALLFLKHMNDKNWSPMIRMEDDQFDLSAMRAQDYILHRPEMQKWVNEHHVL